MHPDLQILPARFNPDRADSEKVGVAVAHLRNYSSAQEAWTAVDNYIAERLINPDPRRERALDLARLVGLPDIQITDIQGQFLSTLVRAVGADRVLEIGTLGGYSTLWLAQGMGPQGRLVTLEKDPDRVDLARRALSTAGLDDVVDVRCGEALDLLPALTADEPFDFVFIDADQPNNPLYVEWGLQLSRRGALLIVDNFVRRGMLADENTVHPAVVRNQYLLDQVASDPRLLCNVIQTVGAKGHDGWLLIHVL